MPISNFDFPKVTVSQQLLRSSTGTDAVLPVCVIGPQYNAKTVARYGNALKLGLYGQITTTGIQYKNKTAGSKVNPNDAHVLVQDALIQIFNAVDQECTEYTFAFVTNTAGEIKNKLQFKNGQAYACFASGGIGRSSFVVTDIAPGDTMLFTTRPESGQAITTAVQITAIQRDAQGNASTLVLSRTISADTITGAEIAIARTKTVTLPAIAADASGITIAEQATAELITSDGDTVSGLPLIDGYGTCYIEYSERLTTYTRKLGSVDAGAYWRQACLNIFGDISNSNPLGQTVAAACSTAGDTFVYFLSVADDSVASYIQALDFLGGSDTVYSIVIVSEQAQVIKACLAEVQAQSNYEVPNYKSLWYGITNPESAQLCTTKAFTNLTSTSVTLIDSNIVSAYGIVIGDIVRWICGTDTFGAAKYAQATISQIAEVPGTGQLELVFAIDDTLILGDLPAEISICRKNYSTLELQQHIIAHKVTASRRAVAVYADDIIFDGHVCANYIAAACAAGMRAAEPVHRPLSNMPYTSISCMETHGMTASVLRTLGSNGIWLIGNNAAGIAINRRQLTTAAADDINFDEQSITTNIDSICKQFKSIGADRVGNSNISPMLLQVLGAELSELLRYYTTYTPSLQAGPQLLQAQLQDLYQDPVNLDAVYATLSGQPPKPFNRFHITFRFV